MIEKVKPTILVKQGEMKVIESQWDLPQESIALTAMNPQIPRLSVLSQANGFWYISLVNANNEFQGQQENAFRQQEQQENAFRQGFYGNIMCKNLNNADVPHSIGRFCKLV